MNILSKIKNNSSIIVKVFLFLITIVLIVTIFPKDYKFKYSFQKNKPWQYPDLLAPFDFSIKKGQLEIDAEKKVILEGLKPYFIFNSNIVKENRNKLVVNFEKIWNEKKENDHNKEENFKLCLSLFDSIFSKGIIQPCPEIEDELPDFTVYIIKNKNSYEKELEDVFTINTANEYINDNLNKSIFADKSLILSILTESITQNIIFDPETTFKERSSQISNISLTRGVIQKGERIISRGELITDQKYEVIESLKREYEGMSVSSSGSLLIMCGQSILISLAFIMLILFLLMFRQDILKDNKKILLILSVIFLMVLTIAALLNKFNYEYISIAPLCLVPIIIRVFFDTRLALFVHLITVIIIGFLIPNAFEFTFLQLISGIVAIISMVRIDKRSQFFLTSVYVFISYSAIYLGINLMQDGSFGNINKDTFLLLAISAALTLLSYPLIFIYEKVFGYVTNISLIEWSDINNKALRELSYRAPGTFQHSLQVANLAEEAVYRIGGNSLLARTGALYHDLGKIENPVYFTENQIGGSNPHDEISMDESAKIIIGHIEKGIEKAKKFKLPEQLIDFIKTHHGTKKTEYFYNLFKKSNSDLDEELFSYKGPLPSSKETAVVMMADAVEAASKSLKQPDREKINNLVDSIIQKQINLNQFKNADITFKDISKIKSIFKNRLLNIYHIRIEYPKL
jgi:hypothetical protein